MPPSCALLGRFAIAVRVLRCYSNIPRTRNVSEYMLVLARCLVAISFCSDLNARLDVFTYPGSHFFSIITLRVSIADAKCILVTAVCVSVCQCVCVCLSVPRRIPTLLHGPGVTWGMVGVTSSCTLLGGFAIGARVSLL